MVEAPNLTERDVQNYAALLLSADAFKEIMRRLKADILRKWANQADPVKREIYYYNIQAIGDFERKLHALVEAKELDDRKEEHAKAERRARLGLESAAGPLWP